MQCRLKDTINAEGHMLPAGTICEVAKIYHLENSLRDVADLIHAETGTLFWDYIDRLEILDMTKE